MKYTLDSAKGVSAPVKPVPTIKKKQVPTEPVKPNLPNRRTIEDKSARKILIGK